MRDIFDFAKEKKIINSLIFILFVVIFIWGAFAPLNTLAVANGKVIVDGKNKPVRALDGGVVKKIYVKDGDIVNKDDLLVKFDDTQLKSEYNIAIHNFVELTLTKDRLLAHINNLDEIRFSDVKVDFDINDLKKVQIKIFDTKKRLLNTQIQILKKQQKSIIEQISGIKEAIKNKINYLGSLNEEIDELEKLYKDNLIDKVKLRETKRKRFDINNELSDLIVKKTSLKVELTKLDKEIIKLQNEFMEKILSNLNDTNIKLQNTKEKLISIKDKINKTNIYSPADGIIDNLSIFNEGAVVKSGENILEIVPKNSKLIIQAMLDVKDIDNVKINQFANIVFNAFKTRMTFAIEGKVSYISADRKIDKNTNMPYYIVEIEITNKGKEQLKEYNFNLKTGMPATAMIKTGSRTMLSYIIKPFLDMKIRAFNEE